MLAESENRALVTNARCFADSGEQSQGELLGAHLSSICKRPCGRRHGPVRRDQPALSRVRLPCRYADPARVAQHPKRNGGRLTATRPQNRDENNRFLSVGRGVTEERFVTVIAGFALGYLTAVLFHGRINAALVTTPGPFQITKPPQGDRHPRGFVQSTILKAITEHPQGMTTAEIITELGPQGIGQDSIEHALGALVQAKKISPQDRVGKYLPAAPEVPTAPDQPSS